ncbi:histidyl-tRNA synthetase [Frankia casuarinae]|uniref:Histidine--tRNA ligase n=1 Tax=Frankia casuarinae (strain DSM 45818 / CECT 9043 / HFP020203 / CcI3) TaxID=106370 RepID=Q2J742_FRACC|nr:MULTISPECIES: histidine--tRNA ligase [Frankia]ABD12900.1 histidyl-tRNA synthetase [Frankia casuarinae]EYT93549.1 histidyl-tRNA synthetase [Frankia casuarinae]KDA43687.1 histidyl-tRNA synthetase [Frankia sp. BMG5.23]OFB41746.1 histidine--tRNA ligase [Frankia sp. CgIM4]ORT95396.1 histidine--tRNA ligase [Frankia casuarinae]
MSDAPIVRPLPVSGFPEWLPEVRLVEQRWLDTIRATFERYGFCSVETPSVEALEVLTAKGETSQEVYMLRRLQADADDDSARLGLHFDLTVPFARYVAAHFNDLVFPFKRYQIQRVWRGERPQEGRFREFTQCDIDVINVDQVPLHFDAELPRIVHEVLGTLGVPPWTLNINNRKVLQGFYEGLGIGDPLAVIRVADKLDKIGLAGVEGLLTTAVGLDPDQVRACLELTGIRGCDPGVVEEVRRLGVKSDLLSEGLDELAAVLGDLADLPAGDVVADLSIARGLDYYTGTVYEAKFVDWPDFGSICSGGRYDNLAGSFIRRNLPGVGISIGLTRIFAKLLAEGLLTTGPSSPADVLVVIPAAPRRAAALATAAELRTRGLRVETYHQPDKVARQVRYASRKGIGFVWFPPFDDGRAHEVKNMATGDQSAADPATWTPSAG